MIVGKNNPYQVAGIVDDIKEVLRPTTKPKKKIYPSTTFEVSIEQNSLIKLGIGLLGLHILTRLSDKIFK